MAHPSFFPQVPSLTHQSAHIRKEPDALCSPLPENTSPPSLLFPVYPVQDAFSGGEHFPPLLVKLDANNIEEDCYDTVTPVNARDDGD